MERPRLRQARLDRGWSQSDLAEHIGTTWKSIHNWELGFSTPYTRHIHALCEVFGCKPEDIDLAGPPRLPLDMTNHPSPIIIHVPEDMHDFYACNLKDRLWTIAHSNYPTDHELTTAIQTAIQEFTMTYPNDSITRRETLCSALCSLAALPMTDLGNNQLTHTHYDAMLRHCTAALEACWQLYDGGDPIGTRYAFNRVCTYVPLLESIAQHSSQRRKEALDLATRYALLQTMLGWNQVGARESTRYAQNALSLSKESGNTLLQLSASTKLSWTYLQSRNYSEAWKTMQKGEHALTQYQRKGARLPSGVIGNLYSSYAVAQIDNGIDPDRAIGVATNSETLNGPIELMEYTPFDQYWEAAWVCNSKGDPAGAMRWLEKLIDLKTLLLRVPQGPGGRIAALNTFTHALLLSKKRYMEQIIKVWTVSIEGAKAQRAEEYYRKAVDNYEIMKVLYPGEDTIRKLAPLTEHW